jgi:hypothetical protein
MFQEIYGLGKIKLNPSHAGPVKLQLSVLIIPFHSLVFTILHSERNFFLEKGLLSYNF